jgi:hypothetical protein
MTAEPGPAGCAPQMAAPPSADQGADEHRSAAHLKVRERGAQEVTQG